jgi:hypothetical protein
LRKYTRELQGYEQIVHVKDPAELKDFLLYYSGECQALICLSCKDKTRLSREASLDHLNTFHGLSVSSDSEMKWTLAALLDDLPLLAINNFGIKKPFYDGGPRSFLSEPVEGWACTLCGWASCSKTAVATDHFKDDHSSYSKYEDEAILARLPLERTKPVMIQRIDQYELPVGGSVLIYESKDEGAMRLLAYWEELQFLVCVICQNRPLLARNDFVEHIRVHHEGQKCFQDLECIKKFVDSISGLKETIEWDFENRKEGNLRFPGIKGYLLAAESGWICSDKLCGFFSLKLAEVLNHESVSHPTRLQTAKTAILVQTATISGQTVQFPVAPDEYHIDYIPRVTRGKEPDIYNDPDLSIEEEVRNFTTERLGVSVQEVRRQTISGPSIPFPEVVVRERRRSIGSEHSRGSSVAKSAVTYCSITKEFKDSYSASERKEILASLWDNPSDKDLQSLSEREIENRLRKLAQGNGSSEIKCLRKFDHAFIYTILKLQHEIIKVEETISHGPGRSNSLHDMYNRHDRYVSYEERSNKEVLQELLISYSKETPGGRELFSHLIMFCSIYYQSIPGTFIA